MDISGKNEGKGFQTLLVILPSVLTVLLGIIVWRLQIDTNQQIDTNGKKIATGLALRAESYKKKLAVYEDADSQMAALVSVMEDLRFDPKNGRKLKRAADTEAKLSEMSKVNGLYITKEVSQGLESVAFTAATMPLSGNSVQALTDQVGAVELQMKKELGTDVASFAAFE
jgi:hypothetical protein